MDHTICCLTPGLTERTRQHVEEAGRRTGAKIAFCERLSASPQTPLLMSVLPVGQRRVPQDLVDRLSNRPANCRVLLLCQEPLSRNLVSLQDGRLLMVGLPLTTGRIEAVLKYGLGQSEEFERLHTSPQTDVQCPWVIDDLQPRIRCQLQQYRGPSWWSAALCWVPPGSGETAPERLMAVRIRDDRFAALLSLSAEPVTEELAANVLDALPGDGTDPKLRGIMGESIAAVWLDLQGGHWGVYGPTSAASAYLLSSLRFPPYTELGTWMRASEGGWAGLSFAPGDVVLLATGLTPEWFATLRGTRGEGTPRGLSLIRMVDEHWCSRGGMGVGLIVEVCG